MRAAGQAWRRGALVLAALAWAPGAWSVDAQALADPRIVRVLVPMPPAEAQSLAQRLVRAGVQAQWRASLEDFLRTTTFGNSMPVELRVRAGHLCLAVAMRYDVDAVMALALVQDDATRAAVAEFLRTHEAVHCASIVLRAPQSADKDAEPLAPALEGLALLREEALADQVAYEVLRHWGWAGYHASVAWQRYRVLCLVRGDLDHWTTPLVHGGLDAVSQADYAALGPAWSALARALGRNFADGSDAQAQAWQAALAQMPPSLRTGLPSLEAVRDLRRSR